MIYTTINKLPLDVFIEINETKDLSLLVIEGEHSNELLIEAWNIIIMEYTQAMANKEVKRKLEDGKEKTRLQTIISVGDSLLSLCEKYPCEKLYNLLFEFGYPLQKLEYSEENLKTAIEGFLVHFRGAKFDYRVILAKEDKEPKKPQQKAITLGYDYFNALLADISIHLNVNVDTKNTMTSVFCMLAQRLEKKIESLNKINAKQAKTKTKK
jgi:hypothetical protein